MILYSHEWFIVWICERIPNGHEDRIASYYSFHDRFCGLLISSMNLPLKESRRDEEYNCQVFCSFRSGLFISDVNVLCISSHVRSVSLSIGESAQHWKGREGKQ